MEKNTYPSYSIYIQQGGQMKKPYNGSKRVQIPDKEEALRCAVNCWSRYRSQVDVLVLRYDGTYDATIIHVIPKE